MQRYLVFAIQRAKQLGYKDFTINLRLGQNGQYVFTYSREPLENEDMRPDEQIFSYLKQASDIFNNGIQV